MSPDLHMLAIRSGGVGELDAVADIMRDAFDPRYGEAWTAAQCAGVLTLPGVWLTLGLVEGSPSAFALARRTLDDGELLLLATRPDRRRQGAAATLLDAVLETAQEHGVRNLHLEVRKGNPAINLYARAGFRQVGERRGYYRGTSGQSYDALTFSRMIG